MKNGIKIIKAEYIKEYKIKITFSDGKVNIVNFDGEFSRLTGDYVKYKEIKNFIRFRIVNGEIVWGENWDVCFHLHQIYNNTLRKKSNAGRKPLSDKKQTVRLYINESIINSHGGMDIVREKCEKYLKNEQ